MSTSSRDRISVDLRGLKSALSGRAEALGVSPSVLVREILAKTLAGSGDCEQAASDAYVRPDRGRGQCVRLCMRMQRDAAATLAASARRAGLSAGDFIGGLLADVPALTDGGAGRSEHVAALLASNAELATLGRHVHRLAAALRQADVEAAKPYRQMLDTLSLDVRRHLKLSARALANLQPSSRRAGAGSSVLR